MLTQVELEKKSLEDYRSIIGDEVMDEIRSLAEPLQGAKVVHVNATAYGGGVAEILQTLVPLMRDVGLDAQWQVIDGEDEFFNVTKAMHNGLQGADIPFTEEMQEIWKRYNQRNAEKFEGDYDFVLMHDPQPAGLLQYLGGRDKAPGNWIWRCHIDTSEPNEAYWKFVTPFLREYASAVFTMEQYVGPGVRFENLRLFPPTIDPLSPKNVPMDAAEADKIVARFGFDPERPLLCQISRFDPWKDPLGVIDAYKRVKEDHPEVQLALVGSMASDDPEGWEYYDRTIRHAGEDFDIKMLHNFHGVGNVEVNAFQTASDVMIQKSTREGFGLVVTEALWKEKPVIGGNVGGIPMQVIDGETGYLVDDAAGCAEAIGKLMKDPEKVRSMGKAAREHVRKNFLTPRLLADYLRLFGELQK